MAEKQIRAAYEELKQLSRLQVPLITEPGTTEIHPSSARFHQLLRDIGQLHDAKQRDYGTSEDPFANVRSSASWNMPAWVGAMVRATDKVKRLQSLASRGTIGFEPAVDAFKDLAVYALIALVLYEEEMSARPNRAKQVDAFVNAKPGS